MLKPWHEPSEQGGQSQAEPLAGGEPLEEEYASIEEIPICEVADLPPVPPPLPIPDVRPTVPEPKTQFFRLPPTESADGFGREAALRAPDRRPEARFTPVMRWVPARPRRAIRRRPAGLPGWGRDADRTRPRYPRY